MLPIHLLGERFGVNRRVTGCDGLHLVGQRRIGAAHVGDSFALEMGAELPEE